MDDQIAETVSNHDVRNILGISGLFLLCDVVLLRRKRQMRWYRFFRCHYYSFRFEQGQSDAASAYGTPCAHQHPSEPRNHALTLPRVSVGWRGSWILQCACWFLTTHCDCWCCMPIAAPNRPAELSTRIQLLSLPRPGADLTYCDCVMPFLSLIRFNQQASFISIPQISPTRRMVSKSLYPLLW